MLGLQELFVRETEKQFQPNRVAILILESELEKIGIFLTDKQRDELESQFKSLEKGTLNFNFDDDQLQEAHIASEEELQLKLQAIVDHFGTYIERFTEKLDGVIDDVVESVTTKMAESVRETLAKRMDDMLEAQKAIHDYCDLRISNTWGKPLDMLQGFIVIADEAAQGYLSRSDTDSNHNIVQNVLLRIQAKSNQISKEILTLLRHGFADGAEARWRSLHELAVISNFIANHGEEVATKYIEHQDIELFKAASLYNKYYTRLGANKISDDDMKYMEEDYRKLIKKYGNNYSYDYGWASDALKLKKTTFRDLEASVELDHVRPYYKAASANIHASPTGVLSRLGLLPEENSLLAGPSDVGLSSPAQSTVISLTQITTTLLTYNTNIDFLVICKAMNEFGKDVETAFLSVES